MDRPLLLAWLCLPAFAAGAAAPLPGFYARTAEGWFWYAPEPDPAPPPAATPEPPPAPPAAPPAAAAPAGPAPLSAAWLRAHLDGFRDAAIDAPSADNVALYLYLQRVALDKASHFADASRRALQREPFLDEITRRPTAPFAAQLVDRSAGQAREAALRSLARETGIWFFFRADCPYCAAQAPLLQILSERYGWLVYPISLDGAALPDGRYPDFRRDAGQAARLGVVNTPALFLARPPDGLVPLGQGLLSLAQLQERLLLSALEAGWLTPAQFEQGRPRTAGLLLDVAAPAAATPPVADPGALLQHLRGLARARLSGAAP